MFISMLANAGATPTQNLLLVVGALLAGVAAAWLAYRIRAIVNRPLMRNAQSWEFEEARRQRLRAGNTSYRWFEPLIDDLSQQRLLLKLGRVDRVRKNLSCGASPLPWTAEEYIAMRTFEGFASGLSVALLAAVFLETTGVVVASLVVAVGYVFQTLNGLNAAARSRKSRFKLRLPFTVDLVALMMEAGASLRESLATVVRENHGHPVGQEFAVVLAGVSRGHSFREALIQLQERMQDEEVKEMVFAITKAEELGTPLSKIFLSLAEQMRLKHTQWVEKAAGKAQAMITFPGLVIMVACLLIVIAPFVINAIVENPF